MKVLLMCANGLSTGILMNKMNQWAKQNNEDLEVKAIPIDDYLSVYKIIIDMIRLKYSDKYISNPEILRNIDKLVDITKYNRILRVAKDFVARRWFMNAKKYNFPIEKCDFYGVIDNRNISKKDWYKSETGINQVMKEFINIGQLTIDKELDIN